MPTVQTAYEKFVSQHLGNTRGAPKTAQLLEKYYREQLANTKEELEEIAAEYRVVLDKANDEARQLTDRYRGVFA